MADKHTRNDLIQMQSLPLPAKIQMTKRRIYEWVEHFGEDGVYVSFSGGKDSTVLLDLVRKSYPEIPAVFVDTGLEYPEIREFVRTFENVVWLKPKMNFRQVIEKYGYPFFSKEISECIAESRKYIKILTDRQTDRQTEVHYAYRIADMIGVDRRKNKGNKSYQMLKEGNIPSEILEAPVRIKQLFGVKCNQYGDMYDRSRYLFMLEAPFEVSNMCCKVMKKAPVHAYGKETGRKPITAQMADESRLRTSKWLQNGCNAFEAKNPISNPMSFWTEQDVLLYVKENDIPLASVYGDIVVDYFAMNQCDNQMSLSDYGISEKETPILKTTGCERTGCMFCGYGCHLEKSPNRFERMKQTHPKIYDYIMRSEPDGGLGYKEIIEWINTNGNMNIKF
jgi:3'-phosphoadenosine 5'-phosphosulfate sulfotransferase (PAPS reductase)/FAD synthetase